MDGLDGWTNRRCRLNDRGNGEGGERRRRNDRPLSLFSFEEIFERGGEKQVELVRLFASRETSRERIVQRGCENVFPACLLTFSLFLFGLAVKNKNTKGRGWRRGNATSWISLLKNCSGRGTFQEKILSLRAGRKKSEPSLLL